MAAPKVDQTYKVSTRYYARAGTWVPFGLALGMEVSGPSARTTEAGTEPSEEGPETPPEATA